MKTAKTTRMAVKVSWITTDGRKFSVRTDFASAREVLMRLEKLTTGKDRSIRKVDWKYVSAAK